jgi:hypothetical protein
VFRREGQTDREIDRGREGGERERERERERETSNPYNVNFTIPLTQQYRRHLDLLEKNNQLILELKHLDSIQTQR